MKGIWLLSFVLLLLDASGVYGQGINYPGNVPANSGGEGNARTDADNLFTRNNPAAMTEIEREEGSVGLGSWRYMLELHGSTYRYERKFTPLGFDGPVNSLGDVALPSLSGEITFTARSRQYAFGLGISQTFGFQSKLKDSETVLGDQAQFFDTRVVSNDVILASAFRLHKKFSVGGSLVFGRGFLVQTAPIQELAQIGIVRSSRLDVSKIGGFGAGVSIHYRPSATVNLALGFKTARKYELEGMLNSVQPVLTPSGLQLAPFNVRVIAPLRLPSVLEAGIKIQPSRRYFFDFDYRFYRYSVSMNKIEILDHQTDALLFSQDLDAKDVQLFLMGGVFKLNSKSNLLFGSGYTTNAILDRHFSPALNNSGGVSFSGGYGRNIRGTWVNAGLTYVLSFERSIPAVEDNPYPGEYRGRGFIFAIGIRR